MAWSRGSMQPRLCKQPRLVANQDTIKGSNSGENIGGRKTKQKHLLMYAFYFSKTICNTSKIKNVANKKVFSTSLKSWGAVTSSPTTHPRQSTHPAASTCYPSDSSVSKVTMFLSDGDCIYECVLLVAVCNVLLCRVFITSTACFYGSLT